MRRLVRLTLATVVVPVVTGAPVAAQEPPADPLDAVRERVALTAADDQAIDAWLTAQLSRLVAANAGQQPDELDKAGSKFLRAFQAQLLHSDNTPQFVSRFTERIGAAIGATFRQANPLPARVVWYPARVLLDMKRIETREALEAGLEHPVPSVRYLCAKSLSRLQADISPDPALARATIRALEAAGRAETSHVALAAIYQALAYGDHTDDAVRALTAVFATRVSNRNAGKLLVADRAELIAWEFLWRNRNRIPEAAKAPLVRQLAAFLVLDVNRYAQAPAPEKRTLQERIKVCEDLLDALVGAAAQGGVVSKAMAAGGAAPDVEMRLELLKWVGSEAEAGSLNASPWSVPVGGGP